MAAVRVRSGAYPLTQSVEQALQAFTPALPLAVGLSGGADSTALLVACTQRWPGQVVAIHVHHGLQAAADDFARHCTGLCDRLGVPLWLQKVDAQALSGQSPEDAARQARYKGFEAAALAGQAQAAIQSIALAHHADDQVETLLLALSRGAGVAGLAAMPMQWQRGAWQWHRPLLRVPGQALRQWLRAQGYGWVEDPMNQEVRYTRNRIRHQLLPMLEVVFPHFRDTFARSSALAAQAQEVLLDVAQEDMRQVGVPPRIAALRSLGQARQANVLRYWLRTTHHTTPSQAQLAQLQHQLGACDTRGHHIHLRMGRGMVRRAQDVLVWEPINQR